MTDDRPPGLWDYAAVVWRRRLVVVVLVAGTLGVAGSLVALRPANYEVTARYRATDDGLAAEVREAVRLRLFDPESVVGLEVTATQAGRGLLVAVVGDPARARAFLEALPAQFRRVAPAPSSSGLGDVEALPPQPVPALPPSPPPSAPVRAWAAELADLDRRLPLAETAERPYLTERALRLRALLEQVRRDEAALVVARERHRGEVERERQQHARQVEVALERRRARLAALVPPAPATLTMVHLVQVVESGRSGSALQAAFIAALVLGVFVALALEWYERERARRHG